MLVIRRTERTGLIFDGETAVWAAVDRRQVKLEIDAPKHVKVGRIGGKGGPVFYDKEVRVLLMAGCRSALAFARDRGEERDAQLAAARDFQNRAEAAIAPLEPAAARVVLGQMVGEQAAVAAEAA